MAVTIASVITVREIFMTTEKNSDKPNGGAKKKLVILALLVLAAAAYGAYKVFDAKKPFEWSGTVEARSVTVGSRVGGRVKEVVAHEGDTLHAGDPIVQLEVGDLEAQRVMAEAALEQAKAALARLEKGARPEEIAQAHAREATTAPPAWQARADLARAARLLETKAISQAEFDRRAFEAKETAARALEAKSTVTLVRAGARIEDIRAARAVVAASQGRLDQVNVMLSELTIRAPQEARVESLDLRPGDILAPNAAAATLIEPGQLFVRIYIPETQMARIHVGDEFPLFFDTFPNREFHGKIESINETGEYTPRNLQTADERAYQVFGARVGLLDGHAEVRAGMAAFMRVPR